MMGMLTNVFNYPLWLHFSTVALLYIHIHLIIYYRIKDKMKNR